MPDRTKAQGLCGLPPPYKQDNTTKEKHMNRFADNHSLNQIIVSLILDSLANPALIDSHYDMACQTIESENNAMDTAMTVEAGYKFITGSARYIEDCEDGNAYYQVSVQTGEWVGVIVNDGYQIVAIEW